MCAKDLQFSSLVQKRKKNVRCSSILDLLLPAQGISISCCVQEQRGGEARQEVG